LRSQYSVPLSQGQPYLVNVPDPGVAINWSYLLPNGYRYQLLSVYMTLITDATVDDRYIGISFSLAGTTHFAIYNPGAIPASSGVQVSFSVQTSYPFGPTDNFMVSPLPFPYPLRPQYSINSILNNSKAGDRIVDIYLYFSRWVEQSV